MVGVLDGYLEFTCMSGGPLAIFGGFYLRSNNGISFLKARIEFLISNTEIRALSGIGLHKWD